MEKIKKEYKEIIKYFFNNKIFIFTTIIVAVLSFGFTITNSSIGVDDTAFDRYYKGKEMLSIGRWGAYVIYEILNIAEFTPFWSDFIASTIIVLIAFLWCVFLKRHLKEEVPNTAYTIFATIFISFPIINEIFIYQNCNIAVILGSLLASIGIMILYENHQYIHKKSIYIICILMLAFGISMYEACFQIILVTICITALITINKEKNNKVTKSICNYIFLSLIIVLAAVILNSVIVKIIYLLGVPVSEAAEKEINWGTYDIKESIQMLCYYINEATIKNTKYLPVAMFNIATIIGFIISVVQAYKKQNVMILLIYIGMTLSNFAITILQLKSVLYRTCTSWSLFVAIIFMVFYIYMSRYKITKIMSGIFIITLVLQQSKYLNQMFYNDYIRYQRDLHIAYELIDDLETSYDISKPLVIMGTPKKGIGKDGSQVNSLSVLWWGKKAFDDNGAEFIKFLNSLGYNFKRPTDEQYQKGMLEAQNMSNYPKEDSIRELEDCIVINF